MLTAQSAYRSYTIPENPHTVRAHGINMPPQTEQMLLQELEDDHVLWQWNGMAWVLTPGSAVVSGVGRITFRVCR